MDRLNLFLFIDAFGWEILKAHPFFLSSLVKDKKRLRTILGYSSACDPSIISGKKPCDHLHFSSFFYSPKTSPFKGIKYLNWIPAPLVKRQRIRNYLSRLIKRSSGITGYFNIYQFPLPYLRYFDYAERKRIWEPGGLNRGKTIFDDLAKNHISYYVGDLDSEEDQISKTKALIKEKAISFAYLLFGRLDALMHAKGTKDDLVSKLIKEYDILLSDLIEYANQFYSSVDWYVFTDHGMHNVKRCVDLQKEVDACNLEYAKDYIAVYDSTMARFWFFNEEAKEKITYTLANLSCGDILSTQKLIEEGVYFPDNRFGELIFLLKPDQLIIPSFMGLKPIKGMHGYDPNHPDSYAMICSNKEIPKEIDSIEKIYHLMPKTKRSFL